MITHDRGDLILAAILLVAGLGLVAWGWLDTAADRRYHEREMRARARLVRALDRQLDTPPRSRW